MRIRFVLAYSPLWERSTRITRAYDDGILWIIPGNPLPPPPKILACDPGTTTSNIGPTAKRCLGIYRLSWLKLKQDISEVFPGHSKILVEIF